MGFCLTVSHPKVIYKRKIPAQGRNGKEGADELLFLRKIRVLIDQQKVAIELLEEELSYARDFSEKSTVVRGKSG